jgi:hypothetical protein
MKVKLFAGIVLVALSYGQLLLPVAYQNFWFLTPFLFAFMLGVPLLCDAVTERLARHSLIREVLRSRATLLRFLAISVIGGIMLDGVAQWPGKLWAYPPLVHPLMYVLFFIPAWALYWLLIAESYLAVKAVLDWLRKGARSVGRAFRAEMELHGFAGVVGVLLSIMGVSILLNDYGGAYEFTLQEVRHPVSFGAVMLVFLGTWLVFEFFEYHEKKASLIHDVLHGYYTPLGAIVIAAFLLGVVWETQNLPVQYWVYTNWPLAEITFFGLPIAVFLTWPLQYVTFLSLFRVCTVRESSEVWRGDAIR